MSEVACKVLLCFLGIAYSLTTASAQSGFCTRDTFGLPVMDMCESGSWTLGRVFLSVNSSSTGDNSRCNCTLRGKNASQSTETTITLWQQGSSPYGCGSQHFVSVVWPSGQGISGGSSNITCKKARDYAFKTSAYTQPVTLTQSRSDVSSVLGFCLFLQPTQHASNNLELTCQGTLTTEATTPHTTPTTPLTSSPAITPTTPPVTPSSVSPTTSQVSISDDQPSPGSDASSDVTSTTQLSGNASSPVLVAMVGLGWALAVVLAAVILLICLRIVPLLLCGCLKTTDKPRGEQEPSAGPGAENSAYTSLSDVTRVDPCADPNYCVIQSGGRSTPASGNDAGTNLGVRKRVSERLCGIL